MKLVQKNIESENQFSETVKFVSVYDAQYLYERYGPLKEVLSVKVFLTESNPYLLGKYKVQRKAQKIPID